MEFLLFKCRSDYSACLFHVFPAGVVAFQLIFPISVYLLCVAVFGFSSGQTAIELAQVVCV